mgnify:CR=1 FL=1|jgi:hypothetical protein
MTASTCMDSTFEKSRISQNEMFKSSKFSMTGNSNVFDVALLTRDSRPSEKLEARAGKTLGSVGKFNKKPTIGSIEEDREDSFDRQNSSSSPSSGNKLVSRADLSDDDKDCNPFAIEENKSSEKVSDSGDEDEMQNCDIEDNGVDHKLNPLKSIRANHIRSIESSLPKRQ